MGKFLILTLTLIFTYSVQSQKTEGGFISGQLSMDTTWDRTVYLSHIPTFEDRYSMSSDMIVSETDIDSLGNFLFDLSFLPSGTELFRIHLTKKGDSRASLIIGGKDENHLLFLANRESQIELICPPAPSPFGAAQFLNSPHNIRFNQITQFVNSTRKKAAESSSTKRRFIENKLEEELLLIADTSAYPMVALYAIYSSGFESNQLQNRDDYSSFLQKWNHERNMYFEAFRSRIPESDKSNIAVWTFTGILLLMIGYFTGKYSSSHKKKAINSLSVQERRVFELLKKGASNQEISEECSIGVSTVKSHVSNIYSKLNIKSRKEVMDY